MEGRGEIPDLAGEHHHYQQRYEELELSLGLSTNGRFGVDPTMNKRLRRSSSSAANMVFAAGGASELWRTRSLPATEAEEGEEWRRRKELQSARKKRMEKLRSLRFLRDAAAGNGNSILPRLENGDVVESPQRSGSGSGSAASSDLIDGLKPKQTAEVSPSSQPISHEQEPKNTMLDMPLVTTKDTGPNGRKVEGFLYGFKKGEEVKIVCVCHGKFLTPKEFVEHGGGGVVEHPLKHILVNPFPLL